MVKFVFGVITVFKILLSTQFCGLLAIIVVALSLRMSTISEVMFGGGGGDKIIVTSTEYKIIVMLVTDDVVVGGFVGSSEGINVGLDDGIMVG